MERNRIIPDTRPVVISPQEMGAREFLRLFDRLSEQNRQQFLTGLQLMVTERGKYRN